MRTDLVITDGKLKFINGDFAVGESDHQHIEMIMQTSPNEWKENPTTGAAIVRNLSGNLTGTLKRNISVQLEADGYTLIKPIEETEKGLIIDAGIL